VRVARLTPPRALVLLAASGVLLAAGLVLLVRARAGSAQAPREPAVAPAARVELSPAAGAAGHRVVEPGSDPGSAPAAATLAPAPGKRARWPKDAQGVLRIAVLDAETNAPVPRAAVRLSGLRDEDVPSTHWTWPGPPPDAETDLRGEVRLPFPAWVRDVAPTARVTTQVSHPDYVSFYEDLAVEDLAQDAVVRLRRRTFVTVSGWIASRPGAVLDVEPSVDDDTWTDGERGWRWTRAPAGRLTTDTICAGAHAFAIAWVSPEGEAWQSRAEVVQLAAGEQREVSLELVPAVTLEGRLDDAVPRPVLEGEVLVRAACPLPGREPWVRTWQAGIRADGSFTLPDLPPGECEVFALCAGWSGRRTSPDPADGGRIAPALMVLPAPGPCVVAMERTATLVVRVADARGAPAAGIEVSAWPDLRRRSGYAQLGALNLVGGMLTGTRWWRATTDADGRARLENLPPEAAQHVELRAARDSARGACWERVGHVGVDLAAGEATEASVVLGHAGD
jgi:hypothetical protein